MTVADAVQKKIRRIERIENVRDLEQFLRYSGFSRKIAITLASRTRVIFQGEPVNLIRDKDKRPKK